MLDTERIKENGWKYAGKCLGITITDAEASSIVTFLKTLKGVKPNISYPQLPESTIDTAKPEFN